LPSASLKDGVLHLDRLEKTVPDGADTLVLKLYGDMDRGKDSIQKFTQARRPGPMRGRSISDQR
jgi:hypothetical protein